MATAKQQAAKRRKAAAAAAAAKKKAAAAAAAKKKAAAAAAAKKKAAAAAAKKKAAAAAAEFEKSIRDAAAQVRQALENTWKQGLELDPQPGEVGQRASHRTRKSTAHAPVIADPIFGRSFGIVPLVNRLRISPTRRLNKKLGTPVGAIVKEQFFATPEYKHKNFDFNVCFAVGGLDPLTEGWPYGNPNSIWFNVFFGYYQLDVLKSEWGRPFGYYSGQRSSLVRMEDVLRVGNADWLYFSNWMYGVPVDCIEPYSKRIKRLGMKALGDGQQDDKRHRVGNKYWDFIQMENVKVVSGYESSAKGAKKLVKNSSLTPVWRATFGQPNPQFRRRDSFVPTKMRGKFYISFDEDGDWYRTVMFGGAANTAFDRGPRDNDRFLNLQLKAVRHVMMKHYPGLGFSGQ